MSKEKTIKCFGIPVYRCQEENGLQKKYVLGIRYHTENIAQQEAPVLVKKVKDVFNLSNNELNVAIKLEGGMGDFLISANYLWLLRKFIGYNKIRIDVFAPNKQNLLDTLFHENELINHKYSKLDVGLADTRYDLLLLLLRKPLVLHAKKNKIYEYSPELFYLVQKYEAVNVKERRLFLQRPFCDGQNVQSCLIKKIKRFQEPDIDNILGMSENYEYSLFIDEKEEDFLNKYNLKQKSFISIHRGVDERSSKDSVKQWPIEYYNILIEKIKKNYPKLKIVQLGFSEDRCPKFNNIDIDLIGKTSLEEGGMVHLRHALHGGKSIVLFGATSPEFYGYSENINLRGDGCSHWCEWITENWQAKCARGYDRPPCSYSLTPETVYNEFKKAWRENND